MESYVDSSKWETFKIVNIRLGKLKTISSLKHQIFKLITEEIIKQSYEKQRGEKNDKKRIAKITLQRK